MKTKNIIWSNIDTNEIDQIAAMLMEEAGSFGDPITEDEALRRAYDLHWEYLEDERLNLSIQTDGDIVVIADLGLWNGRRQGYKTIGRNVKDCLSFTDGDYAEWYVDGYGNLRGTEIHHDGTNEYLYRELKPSLSDQQKENFLDLVYRGKATSDLISRYTRSLGKRVCKVYGW